MIGRLKGVLIHKAPPWLVVDVHGVGYELEAPMSTFYDLPEVGREVFLFVHHAQKEDSVSLYGFLRESERRLFRDVQKVSGIGAKIALAVLSGASVDDYLASRASPEQLADCTAIMAMCKRVTKQQPKMWEVHLPDHPNRSFQGQRPFCYVSSGFWKG